MPPSTFDLTDPPADPYPLFRSWYEEAHRSPEIKYAHAMCLATVDPDGLPEARTVLLKHLDEEGFVFFTDSESPKAEALARLPEAALVFYWGALDRQVRVRGSVQPASDEISDLCFEKRPRGSKLGAWASLQSRPLASRQELDARLDEATKRFEGTEDVPRPPNWRAYRLEARTVEFWQARAQRLHDRLLYRRGEGGRWQASWLYP